MRRMLLMGATGLTVWAVLVAFVGAVVLLLLIRAVDRGA